MCVCVCMYLCMFVYMHVCMDGCMCVCVCVCGFSQTFNPTHLREGQDLLIGNCTGISWPIPWTYNVRTYSSLHMPRWTGQLQTWITQYTSTTSDGTDAPS